MAISMVSLTIWNSRLEFFFARFWKTITLVFLEFISNIQELQKEDNVLRQFCNPILDRDIIINSLSSANYFNVFCHVTLKNHISGVMYSSISSYTSLEREKNTLSKKKYFGHRKPIIFRHKKIKKAYFA